MRFLLQVASKPSKGLTAPSITTNSATVKAAASTTANANETVKAWGQKCSPNCGCTLRFESELDPTQNNLILSTTYHAKTILTTSTKNSDNGNGNGNETISLDLLTTTKGRPIMKKCSCKTLNSLAQKVTETLPGMPLAKAQNTLEFTGVRSSTAFRYMVLKEHGLLRTNNHHTSSNNGKRSAFADIMKEIDDKEGRCYDLVEEALVACLKGYMPQPRPAQKMKSNNTAATATVRSSHEDFQRDIYDLDNNDDDDKDSPNNIISDLNPLRFVQAAKKRSGQVFHTTADSSNNLPNYDPHAVSKFSFPSRSESSSSSGSDNIMPPFHFMNDSTTTSSSRSSIRSSSSSSSSPPSHLTSETLSQIKMEIESMQQEDLEHNSEHNSTFSIFDWVSYVDQMQHRGSDKNEDNEAMV